MPRFIDRLLAEPKWKTQSYGVPPWMFESDRALRQRHARLREDLQRSTVVVIDNVAKYYFQHHTTPEGKMDGPEQFPQLAPPFPLAFYEYSLEPSMYDVMFTDAANGNRRQILHSVARAPRPRSFVAWSHRLSGVSGDVIPSLPKRRHRGTDSPAQTEQGLLPTSRPPADSLQNTRDRANEAGSAQRGAGGDRGFETSAPPLSRALQGLPKVRRAVRKAPGPFLVGHARAGVARPGSRCEGLRNQVSPMRKAL
jgi:hypothetical protein